MRFFSFFKRNSVISGEVFNIHIVVRQLDEPRYKDGEILWDFLSDTRLDLEVEIKDTIKKYLGPDFYISSLNFYKGSIEIFITIGTVYFVISRYKNFVESLNLLFNQLRHSINSFFRRATPVPIIVSGSWSPGYQLKALETVDLGYSNNNNLLLFYLIVSHATILLVLIWLLLKSYNAI